MMNPVFSIAHMRRMIPVFNTVVHRLQEAITMRVAGAGPAGAELDMLMWMGRTALELVGQAGLGYSFDPLVSDSEDEFGAAVKAIQCAFCDFISRTQLALTSTHPFTLLHTRQARAFARQLSPAARPIPAEARQGSAALDPRTDPQPRHTAHQRARRHHASLLGQDLRGQEGGARRGRRERYASGGRGKGHHEYFE